MLFEIDVIRDVKYSFDADCVTIQIGAIGRLPGQGVHPFAESSFQPQLKSRLVDATQAVNAALADLLNLYHEAQASLPTESSVDPPDASHPQSDGHL